MVVPGGTTRPSSSDPECGGAGVWSVARRLTGGWVRLPPREDPDAGLVRGVVFCVWRRAANESLVCSRVKSLLLTRWLQSIHNNKCVSTPDLDAMQPFRGCNGDLSVVDGTLLMGDRVVSSDRLQPTILRALHKVPTLWSSKNEAGWMSNDIGIRQCSSCVFT